MGYQLSAPAWLKASLRLPSSKSISNRVLILNQLSDGAHCPKNLSVCDDTDVMLQALNNRASLVDVRAAGTAMRFLTAYYAITPGNHLLTGTERMLHRPIGVLADALRRLGADVTYAGESGFPPLRIEGRQLEGGDLRIDGHVSSQYVSALLMIAPRMRKRLRLELQGGVVSRPYIDLTLQLMRLYGAVADWDGPDRIVVEPGQYRAVPLTVESDWSAASYWYEMVALAETAEVELEGLCNGSLQGDSRVKDWFAWLGVKTTFTDRGVVLQKQPLVAERMDCNLADQPDLAQTLVVTCALLGVPFRFSGLESLKIKETDRMDALIRELAKLGYVLKEESGSVLTWEGRRQAPEGIPVLDTYDDHRMAMAFAPACFRFDGLVMNNPQVVSKSYPGFWTDLRQAGFVVREV